jgi:hypothetical protein
MAARFLEKKEIDNGRREVVWSAWKGGGGDKKPFVGEMRENEGWEGVRCFFMACFLFFEIRSIFAAKAQRP